MIMVNVVHMESIGKERGQGSLVIGRFAKAFSLWLDEAFSPSDPPLVSSRPTHRYHPYIQIPPGLLRLWESDTLPLSVLHWGLGHLECQYKLCVIVYYCSENLLSEDNNLQVPKHSDQYSGCVFSAKVSDKKLLFLNISMLWMFVFSSIGAQCAYWANYPCLFRRSEFDSLNIFFCFP